MRANTQQSNLENPQIRKIIVQTITAALALAAVLTLSCSSSDDESNEGSSFGGDVSSGGGVVSFANPQIFIYYEDDILALDAYKFDAYKGSGIIVANYEVCDPPYSDNCEPINLNAGSVTNGIIKLELPPTIPDEYLRDVFDEEEQRFCTDYAEGIKILGDAENNFKLTNSNGEDIGQLLNTYFYQEGQIYIFGGIFYWYFSKSGKIACKVQNYDNSFTFSINAKVGWNKIYLHWEEGIHEDRPIIAEYSTNNILTKEKELKWFINLVND